MKSDVLASLGIELILHEREHSGEE